MKVRWTSARIARETLFYLLLTAFGLVMFLPFEWALSTSFQPDKDIFTIPLHWFPAHFTFAHYVKAFTTVPFGRYFLNSFILAISGVATNLFFGSLAGYAFARMVFRGRQAMFRILLTSMMVPGVVTLIPTFIIIRSFPLIGGNNLFGQGGFGLLNTYWAVILPGAAGAFAVFMMRQFFMTLPTDLGEAAKIDGCGEFRIFLEYLSSSLQTGACHTGRLHLSGWLEFVSMAAHRVHQRATGDSTDGIAGVLLQP